MLACAIRRLVSKQLTSLQNNCRTFLSGAYSCNEVWDQRKRANIFKKIDYDDLYHQLDRSFQIGLRISVLDVDLFVNGIETEAFQNELEDVLFKLRLNPETGLLSERTMHAVVKYYIAINKRQDLVDILGNRLNYGIFTDYYAANLLMDSFCKENDFVSAAKVAVLQMLQEDFNHPIMNILSIYSCVKYLKSPDIWLPPKEQDVEASGDDEEDEVRVRVSFIRNPYFDDHFDIVDTNHLVGKTMHMVGKAVPGPIGASSRLIGLVLHEKFEDCLAFLKHDSNTTFYNEAITMAIDYAKVKPKQPEGSATNNVENKAADTLVKALEKLLKEGSPIKGDFETAVSTAVVEAVNESEPKDIQNLAELYRSWEKEREEHIQFEIYESKKRKAAQDIASIKDQLTKREEMIFYFDNEDEWNLKVEQKQEEQRILAEEESKIKKKDKEEEYIPPEVGQRR